MAPKLYYFNGSPPVLAVLLTAKALDLDLDLVLVDLDTGEHLKPEYVKMNPQHIVPTLNDNGYILWDSHAICPYLVAKYGKSDSLYPKDLKKRGTVDQRLHYDSGVMQARLLAIVKHILIGGATTISTEKSDLILQAYDMLETFLEEKTYFAGEDLTIADFSLAASLSSSSVFIPFDSEKHPRLTAWLKSIQALPYYNEANQEGLDKFVAVLKSKLS